MNQLTARCALKAKITTQGCLLQSHWRNCIPSNYIPGEQYAIDIVEPVQQQYNINQVGLSMLARIVAALRCCDLMTTQALRLLVGLPSCMGAVRALPCRCIVPPGRAPRPC